MFQTNIKVSSKHRVWGKKLKPHFKSNPRFKCKISKINNLEKKLYKMMSKMLYFLTLMIRTILKIFSPSKTRATHKNIQLILIMK